MMSRDEVRKASRHDHELAITVEDALDAADLHIDPDPGVRAALRRTLRGEAWEVENE